MTHPLARLGQKPMIRTRAFSLPLCPGCFSILNFSNDNIGKVESIINFSGNKNLLGAPGLTTRSKDATRGSWHRY